jgi:Lrp/AsnC family transcriptional regulator
MEVNDRPHAPQQGCEGLDSQRQARNNISYSIIQEKHCLMDKLDRKILDLLQKDADLTAAEIAERVGLSKAPCWRRIQRLRETGVIRRTVALLDARALNVGTTVFVTIKAPSHSAGWFERFAKVVRDLPEVTELHRMSGDVDYLLRIAVPDIAAYDAVYKRLIAALEMLDVSASFSLETIKSTTALPLHYARLE